MCVSMSGAFAAAPLQWAAAAKRAAVARKSRREVSEVGFDEATMVLSLFLDASMGSRAAPRLQLLPAGVETLNHLLRVLQRLAGVSEGDVASRRRPLHL